MPTSSAAAADRPTGAALARVANRPIVCHVLEGLQRAGVDEVALVSCAWESDELRACVDADGPAGLEVSHLPFGHGGALEQALCAAGELVGEAPCVVHAADGLLTQPLSELVAPLDDDGPPDLAAFVHSTDTRTGSTALGTRRLLRLVESPPNGGALHLAGVCLFGPGALRRAGATRWWQGGELDLATLAEQFVRDGGRLCIEATRGWLHYDGTTAELLKLNRFLLDALAPGQSPVGGQSNRIEGCVAVHPTACVQSSTIVGPVIIGPGALVLESYIRPYTSIGADVRIEGAEVERSIILPGASITHIGGRMVGSMVGRHARIFRDFSLPRAMRVSVGDGGEVALC
jgi:glucose-1-phosphate thymidylyltransferase